MHYPARETGFSWDESRSVWRWEGQFWIFERVYLSNTGGPNERWNMRREFSPKPSTTRRLYYSEADRRYHLQGAAEGWMEAGHLVNDSKDLEFRWYDRDGDGRLDTVQVFEAGRPQPVRESRFDPRARPVALDRAAMAADYNGKVLPEAIADNQELIAALKKVASSPVAEAYEAEAARAEMAERRRYCLDIARELHYLRVREALYARNGEGPYPGAPRPDRTKYRSMEAGAAATGYSMGDTLRYWETARKIARFEQEYSNGRFLEAARTLGDIR